VFRNRSLTGQKEFVEQLVDARKLKVYVDMLDKALKMAAVETGQLLQLDGRWAPAVLGVNGNGGLDYSTLVRQAAERKAEREVEAPRREAEKREREAEFERWHQAVLAAARAGHPCLASEQSPRGFFPGASVIPDRAGNSQRIEDSFDSARALVCLANRVSELSSVL
jgi:hypothetical protein